MASQHDTVGADGEASHFDAIVVGAGFGGLRMLHELRSRGLRTLVIEHASDVGGTWHWNRYPGCRTDSEAWYYCYSFSPEIEQEWTWSERFPSQPEMKRYFQFVADRLDLRKDIRFETRIASAEFDSAANLWTLRSDTGQSFTCRYYIAAQGILSAVYRPDIPGIDDFRGELLFTARWPEKQNPDFAGKRVAIIGTGATGVQLVPVIARSAEHVTVFQRTATYIIPSRNHALDDAQRLELRRDRDEMWQRTELNPLGMPYPGRTNRVASELSSEELRRILDGAWERGTFRFVFELFDDLMTDAATNRLVADFIREKIRSIVDDPVTAELLCPDDHGVGSKRPPLGHHYYEAYNRDNVELVSIKNTPISEITENGIRVGENEWEFDTIIFATGFDAVTGAFTRVETRGVTGETLSERWKAGPETYLSTSVDDFPNYFMILGPQGPFAILSVAIEHIVQFIGAAIGAARAAGADRIEARPDAVARWNDEVHASVQPSLAVRGTQSWLFGANIPGKPRVVQQYMSGFDQWLVKARSEAAAGFPGFEIHDGARFTKASRTEHRGSIVHEH